jgi:hypothetical protein
MKFSLEILSGENLKKLGIGGRIMMKSVLKSQGMRCVLDSNWYGIDTNALNTVMNYWVTLVSYKRCGLVDRKGLEVNTCCRQ